MLSIQTYKFDANTTNCLNEWLYGTNWPIVYIFYNEKSAYVGETLDAIRRTNQHRQDNNFIDFTDVCYISDKTFNKSVILDLESFLIKYMSADGSKNLINGNEGIVDHNYFYREAYIDDFKDVWNNLMRKGIVSKTLQDIENSDIFKYSPYKTLSSEQYSGLYEILKWLAIVNTKSEKSLVEVMGGAGTGKTILAVYLLKLLVDLSSSSISNKSELRFYREIFAELGIGDIQKIISKLSDLKSEKIGFVVPMGELHKTMKEVFKTINGLNPEMILTPNQVAKSDIKYGLLVVDEAHRLYWRKHLPGYLNVEFDKANKIMMKEDFTKDNNQAYTELDWIIKKSRLQIIFYDEYQRIRTADIPRFKLEEICKPRLAKKIELYSQMRCKGGNGYYEYVKKVLEGVNLDFRDHKRIENYCLSTVDSLEELFSIINGLNNESNLCRVLVGPIASHKDTPIIDGHVLRWDKDIFSIHTIQGFDLNYAGVIFGEDVYYDKDKRCICINSNKLTDKFMKSSGEEWKRQFELNLYLILMTRAINGTFVYAVDDNLREYFRYFFK
ncbi:MAG: DUF2075 domain-containing protein [Acidaminococcaceae bacterium]|nr:DUF2075 domain-containing protein [Acidaminococcaceae bacterium]